VLNLCEGVIRNAWHVSGANERQPTMVRNVFRRLERLEARVATTPGTIEIRVLLVHPEKGLTGVLVFGDDNSTTEVPPTPEEVERVRADLERRRAARLL
jgi:hypothetical protein